MKNLLLFFLSDIHLNDKTGEFRISRYVGYKGREYECIQTNESAVDYLMDYLDDKLDALFYFSSKKTKMELDVNVNGVSDTKTHVEWFQERINGKHPVLKDSFHGVDYDEDKDTDESIRQVTEMTEQIKGYLDHSEDKDIRIYADMTGGFRHASMMMLSVLQLLDQYKGIKIEKVLYSNWKKTKIFTKTQVDNQNCEKSIDQNQQSYDKDHGIVEEVTELHRMFTLVSGTDEFVNFGSVKEIDRYFENRPKSKALESLINTMRDFSDAIKICRTNKIEEVVKILQRRIKLFSEEPEKTVHERIFEQIITVLKEEYGKLLSPAVTQLDIIEWCIAKGFLQQAMTLCTEWLPFILVKKKICYTDDSSIKLEALKLGESLQRAWEQCFIISFVRTEPGPSKAKAGKKSYHNAIATYLQNTNAEESADLFPEGRTRLVQLLNECDKNPDIFTKIRNRIITTRSFAERAPMLERACQILWKFRREQQKLKLDYPQFIINKIDDINHFLRQIQVLPENYFTELLEVQSAENPDDMILDGEVTATEVKDNKPKWENREAQYQYMLNNGIMKTKYPDKVMDMLKGFYDIRAERNRINHAASDPENSLDVKPKKTPEGLMLEYLEELRKFK